jgi:undecaprenyl-diphosphatase
LLNAFSHRVVISIPYRYQQEEDLIYATLSFMTTIHALILGIIEGFTEFLPISSTGHMILVSHFLKIPESVTLTTFEIVVQVGAISAVLVTFFKEIFRLDTIKKLIIGFLPTGVIGLLVFPHIKYLLQNQILVACTLLLGGICILITERIYEKNIQRGKVTETSTISYKHAFLLGLFQALAIIPGVSRSGAMIVGGLSMKLSRRTLTEFTFLLAVPTMLIATLYTIYKKHDELSLESVSPIMIGTITSFVVAMVVIRYLLTYIRSHSFNIFGYYRIIIGTILLLVLW